jgi:anti-sigma28 factor (negative regulator of flagellin synthesis)
MLWLRSADKEIREFQKGANLIMVDGQEFADAAADLLRVKTRRELAKRVEALPEIRKEVVNALRMAVHAGMYSVRNEDIAEAICREMKRGR